MLTARTALDAVPRCSDAKGGHFIARQNHFAGRTLHVRAVEERGAPGASNGNNKTSEVTRVGHMILRKASAPVALRANGPTLLRPQEAALEMQVTVNAHDAPTGRRSARTPRPTRLQSILSGSGGHLPQVPARHLPPRYLLSLEACTLKSPISAAATGSERRAMRPARREEMTAANAHAATINGTAGSASTPVLCACCPARLVGVKEQWLSPRAQAMEIRSRLKQKEAGMACRENKRSARRRRRARGSEAA